MVDERNELASMYKGFEQTDLGLRTDVISNIPKKIWDITVLSCKNHKQF